MATSSFSRRRKIRDETENTFDQTLDKECTQKDEDRLQREHFLKPDSDQIDLNLLLDAVLDINAKLRTQEIDYNESADFLHRRPKGKEAEEDRDSKFLQEMLRCKSRQERGNYSFRNDEVFEIDRENQRLLKEITRRRPRSAQSTRCNKSQTKQHEPHRLTTSSEVNRLRFQKRIEQENQALLRRIQAAKPDRSLDREYLMKNEVKPRLRPSSANNRKHVPRLAASSTTSAGMSTRAMSARDYHKTSYPRKSGNEKHDTSPKPAMRKMKPAWEAGW